MATIVSPASAQTMAVLQGRVLDPSGAAVPGASVVVRNSATGFTSTTSSDDQGRYHVPAFRPARTKSRPRLQDSDPNASKR